MIESYMYSSGFFFTKFLVGGLAFRAIFDPRWGWSQMEGGLTSGMESDEGDLEKLSAEAKNAPYSKIRTDFGVLSIK